MNKINKTPIFMRCDCGHVEKRWSVKCNNCGKTKMISRLEDNPFKNRSKKKEIKMLRIS